MASVIRQISTRILSPKGEEEVQDLDNAEEESVARARAAGTKVILFISGSRGDIQPFVALADALQKAGFIVQVPTNVNHVAFLQKFNLIAIPTGPDMEVIIRKPHFVEAMSKGDVAKFMKAVGEEAEKDYPVVLPKMIAAIDAFKPDVMLTTPLHMWETQPIARAKRIPVCMVALQCVVPSKYQPSMVGEPSWFPHRFLGYGVLYAYMKSMEDKNEVILNNIPDAKDYLSQSFHEWMLTNVHPVAPVIIGFSPALYSIKPDWSEDCKKRTLFTGFWIVGKKEQEDRLKKQDSKFGGCAMPELIAFIAGGTPPVYIGWGSMMAVSPEFMACLAIRSLMKAELRGIVLGGWADLSIDKLEGQSDTDAMKRFCEENVLFMKTAPHEWLFPQCSVTVHHGGSGTTAAALRSGVPTIITPIFLDQFDNGLLAQNSGAGLRTCQLGKVTASQLGAALIKCNSNKDMVKKAADLGKQLCREDGIDSAIKALDDWILGDVRSGEYAARVERRAREIAKLRSKPSGCFYYFAQLCCSCGNADWSVKL